MAVLPAAALAFLRGGLVAAGMTRTLQYQLMSAGVLATAVSFVGAVTSDETTEEASDAYGTRGERLKVRTIRVRPMQDISGIREGDRIIYAGVNFDVLTIGGTDIPVLTCTDKNAIAWGNKAAFKAEGG